MSKVVGIDLGTTNTVVAVVSHGQASALSDEHGDKLIPSVVSFHPNGNVLVGRPAKERRLVDPRNTIYSVKRLIGRSWDSEEVRRARTRFPFEMREGPGQAALVVARNETYTLPEISAFVLRKAKAAAEAALGSSIERAVITVPANFNDLQRAATKVAGRVAGLEVMRILNEPTAAALAYGYGKSTSERLAVYDFGGGTFDVTLLDLSDNVFEVLATAGNTFLGGDDIDLMVAEKMSEEFLAEHRYDPRSDPLAFEKLRAAAESIKTRLSSESSVTLQVPEVAHGPGGRSLDLTFAMTRSELERLIAPLVDKTFDVCREALGIARLQAGDFDHVLLVGGSSRIPLVRRRVEEFFRQPMLSHISPDEVVAIGAAIQASALTGAERRRAEVPAAPRPGARVDTQPGHAAARRAEGRGRFDTNPFGEAMSSARGRLDTAQGLNPAAGAELKAGAVRPLVVPPPEGQPSELSPTTADQAERRRQTTGMGLGPAKQPAAPSADVPQTTGPHTDAGLGPRGRVRTGAGLGPAAEDAQGQTAAAAPFIVPPVERGGVRPVATVGTSPQVKPRTQLSQQSSTLLSAREAAAKARAEAERTEAVDEADLPMPMPIGGMQDAQLEDATRPTAGDPPTSPFAAAEALAPPKAPARGATPARSAELTPAAVAAKYGNLPLILPSQARAGDPGAVAMPPVRADEEPTVSGAQADRERAWRREPARAAQRAAPLPTALGRPEVTEDSVAEVKDEDLELLTNEPPRQAPSYSDLRSLAMDEPTRARAAPTSPGLRQREDDLPIPAIPGALVDDGEEEETTSTGASIDAALRELPARKLGVPSSADSGSLPQVVPPKAAPAPRAPAWGSVPTPAPMSRARAEELWRPQPQGPLPPAPTPPPYAPSPQAQPARAPQAMHTAVMPVVTPPAYAQPPAAPPPLEAPPFAAAAGMAPFAAVTPNQAPLDYQAPSLAPPLLVDVTPLSLAVETVSGFCDTLIERNTPVPCERTREFVTAMDNQTVVRVRISQGESQRFLENTLLGEVELAGLPPAPRGQVQIAVSFALDTDGILSVSAREVATGRETSARVRLIGLPEAGQVEQMRVRHAIQPVV